MTNCTFDGNTSVGISTEDGGDGGGAYFGAGAMLTSCTFENNETTDDGAGSFFQGVTTLKGCDFTNNSTINDDGGGAYFRTSATLIGCTFSLNIASSSGGGIFINQTATLTDCNFTSNDAAGGNGGGAYFNRSGGGTTLKNCAFVTNGAIGSRSDGGGAYFRIEATVLQCIFTGNVAGDDGGGAEFIDGGTVINSTFMITTQMTEVVGYVLVLTRTILSLCRTAFSWTIRPEMFQRVIRLLFKMRHPIM